MRWVFRLIGVIVVLAVVAVAALFLLPADKIAGLVTQQFEATTGRAMTLEGDVRPTLWPELGVNTGAFSIANADWGTGGPMLQAKGLSVGVNIGALLGGDIRINRVEAMAPEIVLEQAADGRANWDLGGAGGGGDAGEAGPLSGFGLDKAVISDGRVRFIDHASGTSTELGQIDATASLPDFAGPAEIDLSAAMNGQAFSLSGQIDGLSTFLSRGAVPLKLSARVGGSDIAFNGRGGLVPLAAGGQLTADLSDMGGLFALLGQAAPDLPPGLGQSAGISGDVTLTGGDKLTLRGGTIRLDQNTLTGAADLALGGARPELTAKLTAGALDFSALAGEDSGDGGAPGWSSDRIDVSGLQAIDAQIALRADSVDLGLAKLGATDILTTLQEGRAVTELRQLAAYGGAITGSVVVNSRGGLSARANLTAREVALQPLLTELADYDRLIATGDLSMNLLGVGNDMATLMSSLSGDGSVKMGKGELRGLDLAGMLRTLDTSYVGEGARTIFDGITGTFTVDKGVLSNDDMKLAAPLVVASGAGTVDIGAQGLDYRAVPALLGGEERAGLRVPLLITGSWADPKFRLDLKAMAEEELGDEIEAVKDTAEEAVREKLSEELGVEVENLDEVEDAVKDELEDRLREGLLDLLNQD